MGPDNQARVRPTVRKAFMRRPTSRRGRKAVAGQNEVTITVSAIVWDGRPLNATLSRNPGICGERHEGSHVDAGAKEFLRVVRAGRAKHPTYRDAWLRPRPQPVFIHAAA